MIKLHNKVVANKNFAWYNKINVRLNGGKYVTF